MSFLLSDKKNKREIFMTVVVLEEDVLCFLSETLNSKTFVISRHVARHGTSLGHGLTVDKTRKFRIVLSAVLGKVYEDAQKKYSKKSIKLDGAFSLFAPPWLFADKITISLEGRGSVTVSRQSLIEEVVRKFSEDSSVKKGKKEEGEEVRNSHPWKLSLIEQPINQIKLNGYVLADPYGKKARKIEAEALAVSVFPEMQNLLEKEMESFFKIKEVDEVSLPKTMASFASNNNLKLPAVILFMDKNKTSIVEVRDQDSYDIKVVDCGTDQISQAAMEAFGVENGDVAASYLRLSNEKILAQEVSKRIAASIGESLIDWKFQIKSVIENFDISSFQSVVVVCPKSLKTFFKSFMNDLPVRARFKGIEEFEEIFSNPRNLTTKVL